MEIILGALIIAVGYAAAVAAESTARQKARVRIRELIHDERIKALDKGIPIEDLPPDPSETENEWFASRSWMKGVRLSALAIGLVLSFTGVGMLVGTWFSPDSELNKVATMSLIPIMAGLGLLLFHRLTREE